MHLCAAHLPPVQRQHILEWVRAMIAVTLGSPVDGELPPVYMQNPVTDGDNRLCECCSALFRASFSNAGGGEGNPLGWEGAARRVL